MNDSSNNDTLGYEDVVNKDILSILKADNLPDEEKKKLYEKMLATIQNRVIARITDKLDDIDIEKLKKYLDEKNTKETAEFLKSKNIDWPKMMLEEALIYKTELASLSNKLEK